MAIPVRLGILNNKDSEGRTGMPECGIGVGGRWPPPQSTGAGATTDYVAYWKLDESIGPEVLDISENILDLEHVDVSLNNINAPYYDGSAYSFGENTAMYDSSTELSVVFFYKVISSSQIRQALVTKWGIIGNRSWEVFLNSSGNLQFSINDNYTISTMSSFNTAGTTYKVVAIFKAGASGESAFEIWVNDAKVLLANDPMPMELLPIEKHTAKVMVAGRDDSRHFFEGWIRDVYIYRYRLNKNEILSIPDVIIGDRDTPIEPPEPPPEGYFTLQTYVAGNGTINPSSGNYTAGAVVSVSASPGTDSEFIGFVGALVGSTTPQNVVMNQNKDVTAMFKNININPTEYYVNTSIIGSGEIHLGSTIGDGYHPAGSTIVVSAVPDAEYTFSNFSGDLTGSTTPTNLLVDGDKNITAVFETQAITLTMSATSGGTIIPSAGTNTYSSPTSVPITAIADTNYTFNGFTGDLTGTTSPQTLYVDGQKAVHAIFEAIQVPVYSITMTSSTGGSTSPATGTTTYTSPTTKQIEGIPDTGYIFDRFSIDLTGTTNPQSLYIDRELSVHANFIVDSSPQQVYLTVQQVTGGTVTPTSGYYDIYTDVTIEAIPDTGYIFEGFTIVNEFGTYSITNSTVNHILQGDTTVSVVFKKLITYTLNTSIVQGAGTITKSPDQATYSEGQQVTVTVQGDTNQHILYLILSGPSNTYVPAAVGEKHYSTILYMNSNYLVIAAFEEDIVENNEIYRKALVSTTIPMYHYYLDGTTINSYKPVSLNSAQNFDPQQSIVFSSVQSSDIALVNTSVYSGNWGVDLIENVDRMNYGKIDTTDGDFFNTLYDDDYSIVIWFYKSPPSTGLNYETMLARYYNYSSNLLYYNTHNLQIRLGPDNNDNRIDLAYITGYIDKPYDSYDTRTDIERYDHLIAGGTYYSNQSVFNTWNMLSVVKAGDSIKVYVNDTLLSYGDLPEGNESIASLLENDVYLARANSLGTYSQPSPPVGYLDEISFMQGALNVQDITNLYNAGIEAYTPNKVIVDTITQGNVTYTITPDKESYDEGESINISITAGSGHAIDKVYINNIVAKTYYPETSNNFDYVLGSENIEVIIVAASLNNYRRLLQQSGFEIQHILVESSSTEMYNSPESNYSINWYKLTYDYDWLYYNKTSTSLTLGGSAIAGTSGKFGVQSPSSPDPRPPEDRVYGRMNDVSDIADNHTKGSFTMIGWAKLDLYTDGGIIIAATNASSQNVNNYLRIYKNRILAGVVYKDVSTNQTVRKRLYNVSETAVTLGVWNMISLVVVHLPNDLINVTTYYNGIVAENITFAGKPVTFNNALQHMCIGSTEDGSTFKGEIDEASIILGALSIGQINNLYNIGKP